jgi:hypothetical protein
MWSQLTRTRSCNHKQSITQCNATPRSATHLCDRAVNESRKRAARATTAPRRADCAVRARDLPAVAASGRPRSTNAYDFRSHPLAASCATDVAWRSGCVARGAAVVGIDVGARGRGVSVANEASKQINVFTQGAARREHCSCVYKQHLEIKCDNGTSQQCNKLLGCYKARCSAATWDATAGCHTDVPVPRECAHDLRRAAVAAARNVDRSRRDGEPDSVE